MEQTAEQNRPYCSTIAKSQSIADADVDDSAMVREPPLLSLLDHEAIVLTIATAILLMKRKLPHSACAL